MSRSIHTTRRDLEEELLWDRDGERAERLREQLRRKRAVKWQIWEERHTAFPPLAISFDGLPVKVLDYGPHIVYGASEADVRAVLRRLPPGSVDGLAGVSFSLVREAE